MKSHRVQFLIVLCALPSVSLAEERRVPDQYDSIQAALEASSDGDRVIVAPGRYYETLRFPEADIHLMSSGGPSVTTIDGQLLGTVVDFQGAPGPGAILEGFTITNGVAAFNAGGVHMDEGASATVRGNVIRQNFGHGAGYAISLFAPLSPLIEGNEIRHNRSGSGSGGGGGGGIGIHGSSCPVDAPDCGTVVRDNYIGNNYVDSYSDGGGIYLNGARAHILGNVIEFNTASNAGGGISSVNGSNALIENNLIRSNIAGEYGGGIYSSVSFGDRGPHVINNTLVDNEAPVGSGIRSVGFDAQSLFSNNLVRSERGSALDCESYYDNQPPQLRHNNVHVTVGHGYSGLCEPYVGTHGNIAQPPQFVDEFDFRLADASPGIDAGENRPSVPPFDLAGHPRIVDGDLDGEAMIDIGAYEAESPRVFEDGFEGTP